MQITRRSVWINKKTGKVVQVRYDWTEFSEKAGFVQFNNIDADSKKVGPMLSSKITKFLENYEAAR